ncbi:hypothetical protein KIN20_011280 [Parelaphostrongylus tenuis]|uniref:Uncharacterized protein n=1 Tax=Parelaphostrongylus tenuis TaxID=148309 RepID=A0AAD5MAR5_PARTN|nr:hypothetical protein KIN20_011280 [Parelaphostrongylus tenuis]
MGVNWCSTNMKEIEWCLPATVAQAVVRLRLPISGVPQRLSYADKSLSDVHRKFRDLYKNVLLNKQPFKRSGMASRWYTGRQPSWASCGVPRRQVKSQKTIESIMVRRAGEEKRVQKTESHLAKVLWKELSYLPRSVPDKKSARYSLQ